MVVTVMTEAKDKPVQVEVVEQHDSEEIF